LKLNSQTTQKFEKPLQDSLFLANPNQNEHFNPSSNISTQVLHNSSPFPSLQPSYLIKPFSLLRRGSRAGLKGWPESD
jgi:hypothetical protein